MNAMTNADVFWSGVIVGAVVMAALVSLAQSAADEVQRLRTRTHLRASALPRRRW